MKLASLNRWQAAAIHLALSALIAATAFGIIIALWYPGAYFEAMGGKDLLIILITVDVCIGPLLTLIVFNPAKKELRRDLAIIAAFQVAALLYGAWITFGARPVFTVFAKDHFDVVAANGLDAEDLAQAPPEFRGLSLTGPRVVGVRMPEDVNERNALVFATAAGKDLQNFPKYYVPYSELSTEVKKSAKPLNSLLRKHPDAVDAIRAAAVEAGRPESLLLYVPLRARLRAMTAVLDARDFHVITIAPIDPY
jgi:predicted outer membrane lipoprotein